jgi:cytosine/adenosine deaminase-related metal-dependent hydrolase
MQLKKDEDKMLNLQSAGWVTRGATGKGAYLEISHAGGVITAIEQIKPPLSGRRLLLPAFANAHDHARPLPMSSFGGAFMPLETWLLRSKLATPTDPYLAAIAPIARAARSGCGSMMVHYMRPSGKMPLPEEAAAVARAARDVGVRIAFALSVRDQNPLVYGDDTKLVESLSLAAQNQIARHFSIQRQTPQDYLDIVDEIATAIGCDMVDVQYGPAAPQSCSTALLEAIARRSSETGRRVHMHLLETRYQRAWADREFPNGIVRHLNDIGLLSERLTLAHCVYARPEELDMIASAGTAIVTNFSSNLQLKSGMAPIGYAIGRGCSIAVGMDGLAFDEDDDMVRELRLAYAAHNGFGFDQHQDRHQFLQSVTQAGRRVTGAPGNGDLEIGAAADFISIDLDALDRDRLMEVDPLDLLFARGNQSYICDVVVAGRAIVKDSRVTGIDLGAIEQELRALYREALPMYSDMLDIWPSLKSGVQSWMIEGCGCC